MRSVLATLALMAAIPVPLAAQTADPSDPYIWLEDVYGAKPMAWVREQNARTQAVLESDPRYPQYYAEALAIAQSSDRIPAAKFIGGQVYNFWQDADHVRGIWRRASVASYATGKPAWQTVLDLDALAAAEKANWVWKGSQCSQPAERRCLISLSDGGEDAVTIREFDLTTGKFVPRGFVLPKGKQRVAWADENTLLVSREWRKGELGRTGYPYIVKRLRRGQPLSAAVEIFRGGADDGGYGVTPYTLRDGQNRSLSVIVRPLDTFRAETYVITPRGVKRLPIAAKASLSDLVGGRVIVQNQEDWRAPGSSTVYPAGALVALDLASLRLDPAHPKASLIFNPSDRQAIQSVTSTRNLLLVSILDNVSGRTLVYRPRASGGWQQSSITLPDQATIAVASANSRDDRALIAVDSFLDPPSVWLANAATASARKIMSQPPKFDASNLIVEQKQATSSDGTKVPYFLVRRKDIPLNGSTPTLLTPYGGFEVAKTPTYSATTGKLWLEHGGAFVLANIRGGGEFGPKWHEAGLNVHRQIIYDDFAAVAKDLIATKVTSPRRLGISGGSNGGLLTGVQFTQHPELWNAVVIDVPLLDMIRISKIAAGASWEGEYGSVEDPAVRAFWDKTSPYQNLKRGGAYPTPFIFTTTKDDRVGPQHARKFAARMQEYGLPYYFYEETEGGHSAGANLKQQAHTNALHMIYLTRRLMDDPAK